MLSGRLHSFPDSSSLKAVRADPDFIYGAVAGEPKSANVPRARSPRHRRRIFARERVMPSRTFDRASDFTGGEGRAIQPVGRDNARAPSAPFFPTRNFKKSYLNDLENGPLIPMVVLCAKLEVLPTHPISQADILAPPAYPTQSATLLQSK